MLISKGDLKKKSFASHLSKFVDKIILIKGSIRGIMFIFKDILTIIKHIKLYLRQHKKCKDKLN